MALVLTFVVPALIGVLTGLRGYKDRPRTSGQFALGGLWAMLYGTLFVFAWHMSWLSAFSVVAGTAQGLVGGALFNLVVSFVIWFPCLMISYTFNAQRGLRNDR